MRTPAALVLAAQALSACGDSDPPTDAERVRAAIGDYAEAVRGDDPERVCELLVTVRGRRPPERCDDRVGGGRLEAGQSLGTVRVRAVRVRGAAAVAVLEGGERVRLLLVGERWRIVTPG